MENINRQLSQSEQSQAHKSPRVQALIDGVHGIALQSAQTTESKALALRLLNILNERLGREAETKLSFDQKLDVLWSACALELEQESVLVEDLYTDLHLMNFQRTHNDLTYNQF